MKELTSEAQQGAIHLKWGFLPVFMVRMAVPAYPPGTWRWGRWRYARLAEVVDLNSKLRGAWKE